MPRSRLLLPQLRRPRGAGRRGRLRGLVRTGRLRDESGFTLIEVMVATGVILTSLVMVGGVLSTGLIATGIARQRQSANGLANQALEQMRSIPFDTLKRGLDDSDLSGDPNITGSGCPATYCFSGEGLVHSGGNNPVAPLVPHRQSMTLGPTSYTVSTYVTNYQNITTSDTYRVTVHVDWTSKPKGTPAHVQVQTIVFSPKACLSTVVHPVSGPCQPSLATSALSEAATVTVTGTVAGETLDHLVLSGPRSTSDELVEQIWRTEGLTQAAGGMLQLIGGTELSVGRQTKISKADNDPAAASPPIWDSNSQSTAAASVSSPAVTLATSGGDIGSTTSTTSASPSSSPPRPCPNLSGLTNETDNLPCGGSSATQGSTVTASTTINTLGLFNLARIGALGTPTVAVTDRNTAPGTGTPGVGTCPTTSGDGCSRSYMSRSVGDIGVAGLGSLGPLGFDYYAKILGYGDLAKAESGVGTNAPSAVQSSGTISYWSGIGYTTTAVGSITVPITIPTLSINTNPLVPALGTQITLTGSIQPASTSTSSTTTPTGCTGICTRTDALATSTGPSLNINMTVVVLGVNLAELNFVVNTGTIEAKASYAPTPAS